MQVTARLVVRQCRLANQTNSTGIFSERNEDLGLRLMYVRRERYSINVGSQLSENVSVLPNDK
jgi:hypothetical protein